MSTIEESSPRKTLVRHDGRLKSLGEIPGADLAAMMTRSQCTEIAGRLRGHSPTPRRGRLTRLQTVAHAVNTDPECQGKAAQALAMLADDELASVPASGLISLLRHAPKDGQASEEQAARDDLRAAIRTSQGQQAYNPTPTPSAADVWDKAVSQSGGRQ